jgi:hypothetical protein
MLDPDFDPLGALQNHRDRIIELIEQHNAMASHVESQAQLIKTQQDCIDRMLVAIQSQGHLIHEILNQINKEEQNG